MSTFDISLNLCCMLSEISFKLGVKHTISFIDVVNIFFFYDHTTTTKFIAFFYLGFYICCHQRSTVLLCLCLSISRLYIFLDTFEIATIEWVLIKHIPAKGKVLTLTFLGFVSQSSRIIEISFILSDSSSIFSNLLLFLFEHFFLVLLFLIQWISKSFLFFNNCFVILLSCLIHLHKQIHFFLSYFVC